jgi:hypothetical protein
VQLNNILLEATPKTPQIDLNNFTGELIFSGKSIPENAALVYEGVMKWILDYVKDPRPTTNLRLSLEYFNTATAIWLGKIVQTLSSIKNSENTLIIHLYFNIEEFNSMDTEDLKDELHPIIHMIGAPTMSIGIKIYGVGEKKEVLKESMILL